MQSGKERQSIVNAYGTICEAMKTRYKHTLITTPNEWGTGVTMSGAGMGLHRRTSRAMAHDAKMMENYLRKIEGCESFQDFGLPISSVEEYLALEPKMKRSMIARLQQIEERIRYYMRELEAYENKGLRLMRENDNLYSDAEAKSIMQDALGSIVDRRLELTEARSSPTVAAQPATVSESDMLRRKPATVITYGPDEFGEGDGVINHDYDTDLNGRINARGRAAVLREEEVDRASHYSNIEKLCRDNLPMMEELADKFEMEGCVDMEALLRLLIIKMRTAADDTADKVHGLQYDVRKPYHVGNRDGMSGPNHVEH